jgi:hypothetical protein
MPLLEADYCDKESFDWSVIAPRKDVGPSWDNKEAVPRAHDFDWPRKARDQYEGVRRVYRVYKWHDQNQRPRTVSTKRARLKQRFLYLAAEWKNGTQFISSSDERILHPAYQSIIALGPSAVPFVLEELQSNHGHWFWALHFMSGENPVPEGANISQARTAWLEWGKGKGFL